MEQRFILRLAEIDDIPSIMEIEQICFDKDSFFKTSVYLSYFSSKRILLCSRISAKGGGTILVC